MLGSFRTAYSSSIQGTPDLFIGYSFEPSSRQSRQTFLDLERPYGGARGGAAAGSRAGFGGSVAVDLGKLGAQRDSHGELVP